MKHLLILSASHILVGFIGFAAGIYILPVLTAAPGPSKEVINLVKQKSVYEGSLTRDLPGSDFLHWGEGQLYIMPGGISLQGELAPGPDYQVYLSPVFVDDEASFEANKHRMQHIAPVNSFNGFSVAVPDSIDVSQYSTVVIWCESFGEFISAGRYQKDIAAPDQSDN